MQLEQRGVFGVEPRPFGIYAIPNTPARLAVPANRVDEVFFDTQVEQNCLKRMTKRVKIEFLIGIALYAERFLVAIEPLRKSAKLTPLIAPFVGEQSFLLARCSSIDVGDEAQGDELRMDGNLSIARACL